MKECFRILIHFVDVLLENKGVIRYVFRILWFALYGSICCKIL